MATPHIAGIVAQLAQANPNATPAQIENAIKSTAYKYAFGAPYEAGALGTTSFDKGYGLVDVVATVSALRQLLLQKGRSGIPGPALSCGALRPRQPFLDISPCLPPERWICTHLLLGDGCIPTTSDPRWGHTHR